MGRQPKSDSAESAVARSVTNKPADVEYETYPTISATGRKKVAKRRKVKR